MVLTGCQKQEDLKSSSSLTLVDFEATGIVYGEDNPSVDQNLGKTKETALTALLFREDATLYTRDNVEAMKLYVDGKLKPEPKIYWTDLTIFYKVTSF